MKPKRKKMRRQSHHRKQRRPRPRRRPRKQLPPAAPQTTALAVRHPVQERTLKPAEIELLKKTVAKNCTDEEFALFMLVCKKKKLDPFTKQVYAIKWPRRNEPDEMVIIVGIGGYRSMAARSHKRDFGGTSEPTWTFNDSKLGPNHDGKTPAGRKIPDTASVKAFRKGGIHVGAATVFWEEFAPPDLKEKRADFWNRMPKHMLAKCAESHALRKCFPDLSDIYSEEEMSQRLADLTPGGRQISHDGVAPSGKNLRSDRQLNPSVNQLTPQEILEAKKRGDWCEQHHGLRIHCPTDEHTQAENDAWFEKDQQDRKSKTIDVDAKVSGEKSKPKPKPHTVPEGADMQRGTVHRVIYQTKKDNGQRYISVKVNGTWYNCWSKTIQEFFPSEAEMVSKIIEFYLDKAHNIVGLHRLGNLYFQADGRTPIKREPGEDME